VDKPRSAQNGAVFYMLAALLGTASDSYAAGPPISHKFIPTLTTSIGKTYTFYHDLGDGPGGGNVRRAKRGTVTSLHFSADPGSPLMVDFSALADMYDTAAMPTIVTYVTDEMQMGYNGTITIPSHTAATAYSCNITSADITLSRPTDPLPTIQGISIKDITPGKLELSASINFEYDGLGANKIHDDWTLLAQQGTSANPALMRWTDENNHFIEFKFWPFRISDLTISPNGNYMSGTMTVSPYNDLVTLFAGWPQRPRCRLRSRTRSVARWHNHGHPNPERTSSRGFVHERERRERNDQNE
jgi:hypothetical protein